MDLWALIVLPVGLGLLGFIEPCTVGSSLLFVKYLEGKQTAAKVLETEVFAVTRAVFIGALGAAAALVGRVSWMCSGSSGSCSGPLTFCSGYCT